MTKNKLKRAGWASLVSVVGIGWMSMWVVCLAIATHAISAWEASMMTPVTMFGCVVGAWVMDRVGRWASMKFDAAFEAVRVDEEEAKASMAQDKAMLLNDVQYALRQLREWQCIDRAVDALERVEDRLKLTDEDLVAIKQYEDAADAVQGGE